MAGRLRASMGKKQIPEELAVWRTLSQKEEKNKDREGGKEREREGGREKEKEEEGEGKGITCIKIS